jgi:O-antigen/teichoic acid export membrane protein
MESQRLGHPTPRGRSEERYRRVAFTTLTSAGARLTSVMTMIVIVPLTIHYLGSERYGMWMAITSSVLLLTFADLGIGNGLLNAISESTGKDDLDAVQQYVSSAFFLLLLIATVLVAVFLATYPLIPWERGFNVNSPIAVGEARPAVAVFLMCFALSLPLGIVQRVHFGLQEGFSNDLWVGVGNIVGLAALLFAVKREAGLPWLVLALTGAPVLSLFLNGVLLFRSRPWLVPRWSKANAKHMRHLLKLGVSFVVLQTCLAVVSGADNLIVAHQLGSSAVTQYSVPMRMFSGLPVLLIMALNPLWPAYGESIARGDIAWARQALSRSLKLIFFSTITVGTLLVLLGPKILALWVHGQVQATFWLLAGMACWMVLSSAANAISIFLNAGHVVRVQAYSAIAMCATATVLKLLLVGRIGLSAVIWSTDVAYLVFIWIPILIFVPRYLATLDRRSGLESSKLLEVAPAYD